MRRSIHTGARRIRTSVAALAALFAGALALTSTPTVAQGDGGR